MRETRGRWLVMQASIVSATDAGRALPGLLNKISTTEGACYITDGDGRARAVLLDIDRYNAMMDALEDEAGAADVQVAGALLRAILKREPPRA
jgi:PHD/YefM family antitoxin component YafN of YafNO toxin-antitoxin module